MPNYLYALNKAEELVHINEVDKSARGKFTCLQCREEMISRLGKTRVHHFAHKSETNCSYESYLHLTAKQLFLKEYSQCLSDGEPFYLERAIERKCNTCEDFKHLKRTCELSSKVERYNLTQHFDKIEVERMHEGFIADVLLWSTKHDKVLFIEFAVTHKCEDEKLKSGLRIIEVEVKNENDLDFINERVFSSNNPIIKRHNFKLNLTIKPHIHRSECDKRLSLFTISKEGRAELDFITMSKLHAKLTNDDYASTEVFENNADFDSFGREYMRLVKKHALDDVPVKNCFACKLCVANPNANNTTNTICKKLKKRIPDPNYAHECKYFCKIDGTEKAIENLEYSNWIIAASKGVKPPNTSVQLDNEYSRMSRFRDEGT